MAHCGIACCVTHFSVPLLWRLQRSGFFGLLRLQPHKAGVCGTRYTRSRCHEKNS